MQNNTALKWVLGAAKGKRRYVFALLTVQILLGASGVYYAVLLREVIDTAVEKNRAGFFAAVAAFAVLVLGQIALRSANRFLEEYSRSTLENRFKQRLLDALMRSDYAAVSATHSGEWLNRLTSDTVVVSDGLVQILPSAAGMTVKLIGAVGMILYLEPLFGWLLLIGGLALVVLTYAFRKMLKKLHKRVQETDGSLRVFLQEGLGSLLVVRAFAKEPQILAEAEQLMGDHKKARMAKNHFSNLCNIGFGGVMNGAYVVGAAVCGYGILQGTMSYGTLMAILQLISQVQNPFANITGYLPKYYAMLGSAERLMETEKYPADCLDAPVSAEEIERFYEHDFAAVSLQNAAFTYQPPTLEEDEIQRPVVFTGLNLDIKKGEYAAFTGPSGCGKSTIFKLLLCLYPLDNGVRCLQTAKGNQPLTAAWRGLFAYVPQGNQLMSGTIRDAVTFSSPADEAEIWRALNIACAEEFVRDLPLSLDTPLGEHGRGLSEGQLQRLAIARAVYSKRPVLLLDEATSALDEATEKQLLHNLRAMTDKTVLTVTHRPAVLEICDKIINCTADGVNITQCEREENI